MGTRQAGVHGGVVTTTIVPGSARSTCISDELGTRVQTVIRRNAHEMLFEFGGLCLSAVDHLHEMVGASSALGRREGSHSDL